MSKDFNHTVCWPKQETVIGTWHGGQDKDFLISFSFSFIPHGVFDEFISSLTNTESWHIAGHKCKQSFNGKLHCCLQLGHSSKWHKCDSRSAWWQSDGFLIAKTKILLYSILIIKTYRHNLLQRGFRVCFSQPHGTVIDVCPHAHVTSTLCVHG